MTASWLVAYTPRRVMYLVSVTGMLVTFASWTGASASFAQTGSESAAGAVVAMIFLYCKSPYPIGVHTLSRLFRSADI